MGKKKHGLGRSLVKDRFGGPKRGKTNESFLHTSELEDGYDWGRLNLQSVTEQSQLDEFLTTAELAGTEFNAEKLNVTFVNPEVGSGLLTQDELKRVEKLHEDHRELLCIPRRPEWDNSTSASELERLERESFLEWRRGLSDLQENKGIIMTPFEKNLDFWRQLWRVIERSDVVVQIVDARHPQLFRCEDLENYVKEIDETKTNLVLINKADLLSEQQRETWADYYSALGVKVAFWSAVAETQRIEALEAEENEDSDEEMEEDSSDEESEEEVEGRHHGDQQTGEHDGNENKNEDKNSKKNETASNSESQMDTLTDEVTELNCESCNKNTENTISENQGEHSASSSGCSTQTATGGAVAQNSWELLDGEQLLALFKSLHPGKMIQEHQVVTVGMVGYPNVGKSSTINAILQSKKVPVSATPGRTKHFQTLYVDPSILLCDCPGLVMPTFVSTKAEMVVNGILPIDQMRDHVPPVNLICQRIPRQTLESIYGINIPKPREGEDPSRVPAANELLNAYGYMRGYMTSHGVPDCPRTSRYVLKDYVNGKLLYCHLPPGITEAEFGPSVQQAPKKKVVATTNQVSVATKPQQPMVSSIDKDFFRQSTSQVHTKGGRGLPGNQQQQPQQQQGSSASVAGKPWKKHGNKNKKEKLRRIHGDFD